MVPDGTGKRGSALTDRGQAGDAFEERIRTAMSTIGLPTIEALVERSGIDRGRWYRWFAGKSVPRGSTLRKLAAREIGLTYDQLAEPWGELVDSAGPATSDGAGLAVLAAAIETQAAAISRLVDRFEALASDAIRDGIADALREAGISPADGELRHEPHHGRQP